MAAKRKTVKKDEEKYPPFYVPEGTSITSKKGVLADGDEVKAEYLSGGEKTLNGLVKSGHVKKGN